MEAVSKSGGAGGARPGAGRKPGSPNKATIARQAEIAASGETPLEYMMRVMRDPSVEHDRRDRMSAAAAPYVHPRLATMTHAGDKDNPIEHSVKVIFVKGDGKEAE